MSLSFHPVDFFLFTSTIKQVFYIGVPILYQISIQIIKTNNLLSPAMRHQTIHILYIRIKLIQFFDKSFDILLLKI